MRMYVGITDWDWFRFLRLRGSDEANFWRPTARTRFRALEPGEVFLFKLHAPRNFIVGGGVFSRYTSLPLSLAWSVFGPSNGTATFDEFATKIQGYRSGPVGAGPPVGCIILEQPFFLEEDRWLPWPYNIGQQGKRYESEDGLGRVLWDWLREVGQGGPFDEIEQDRGYWSRQFRRYGQGDFRAAVIDAYGRQCTVTREHTLPILEAAHIQPYVLGGPHVVQNGLLLRADVHKLFDLGYVTVDEDYRFRVSDHLRDDWQNGRDYYARHGTSIFLPPTGADRPSQDFLEWHRAHVFIA